MLLFLVPYRNVKDYQSSFKREIKRLTLSEYVNTTEQIKANSFHKEKVSVTPAVVSQPTFCPVLSIRDPSINDDITYSPHCKPWKQTEDICKKSNSFYLKEKDVYCSSKSKPEVKNKVCSFITSAHTMSTDDSFKIHCDRNICQSGRLFVGSIDRNNGILLLNKWEEFSSAQALELALPKIVQMNMKNGFSFCLIRCVKKKENIDQLLIFPKVLLKSQLKNNAEMFNINVVVLDSVSRNHFYRMLTKTTAALTQIAAKQKVKILDYEFLQSLAPYTYSNIRALMTGSIGKEFLLQLNRTYGINHLFGAMKKRGYKTLLQEESCWYDYWGTILGRNVRRDKLPENLQQFTKSWTVFKKMINEYAIDDYGLTHFSCIVFNMHKVSNMFNKPLKICYNGEPFGFYTLDYVKNVFTTAKRRKDNEPIFSYLHANTGHDITGIRIKVIDEPLSKFVEKMAHLENTLTIMLSDHGPKTTPYSQKFLYGRYETYDSVLFMIIPEMVQQKLGKLKMDTLIKNQKAPVTMIDVHETLMDVINENENHIPSGLFALNIRNRTCDSLGIVDYGICKCRGWETIFNDQSSQFTWLAEFATGTLNNKIQEQFSQNNQYGFGKCQRLQLHSFQNIRQRFSNNSYITTFDLVVQPFETIFLIQTRHEEKDGTIKQVELDLWRRVSIFRHHKKCKDPSVDVELCVCEHRRRKTKPPFNALKILKKATIKEDSKVEKTFLNCLHILSRNNRNQEGLTTTYEVFNLCSEHFKFIVNGSEGYKFPLVKELKPNTINFLFSRFTRDESREIILKYTLYRIRKHEYPISQRNNYYES